MFAVFTEGISGDNKQEALQDARDLQNTNVYSYWDPRKFVGTQYSEQFEWKDTLAWDVYLFFDAGKRWTKPGTPPTPDFWFHQRSDVSSHSDRKITGRRMHQLLDRLAKQPSSKQRKK